MFASSDTHTITNCLPLFSFCQYCYVSETHHPLDLCSFCVLCLLCIICFFFSSLLQRPSWFKVGSIEGCCFFADPAVICALNQQRLSTVTPGKTFKQHEAQLLSGGDFSMRVCVYWLCVSVSVPGSGCSGSGPPAESQWSDSESRAVFLQRKPAERDEPAGPSLWGTDLSLSLLSLL